MYDITFILTVSTNVVKVEDELIDYGERLLFFKEYGLLNIKNTNTKIFLLVGNEDIDNIEDGWSCDIEVIKSDYSSAAHRYYKFYTILTEERINESKWFIQVDDDSITNVDDLFNILDKDYNYMNKYNISGTNFLAYGHAFNISVIFKNLIFRTSYKDIINDENIFSYCHHGYEHTIFSQGALNHFILNPNNKKILEESLAIKVPMVGDSLVPVCSNLCGIPFYEVDYLTLAPEFGDLITKRVFHIHYIYKEKNTRFLASICKKILESK